MIDKTTNLANKVGYYSKNTDTGFARREIERLEDAEEKLRSKKDIIEDVNAERFENEDDSSESCKKFKDLNAKYKGGKKKDIDISIKLKEGISYSRQFYACFRLLSQVALKLMKSMFYRERIASEIIRMLKLLKTIL